ncbi:UNVERIFIED_CONTAM: hypothetical protein HDU68_003693 [Siphonaria sp. JEL0065]|nr:hypothetical protein HDU68_003693 [Siphonaria sp. JEL0065]
MFTQKAKVVSNQQPSTGSNSAPVVNRTTSRRPIPVTSKTNSSSGSVDGTGGSISGTFNPPSAHVDRMRKQLDDLRYMQMELAKKHTEIGSSALDLSSKDLDPTQSQNEGDPTQEKKYAQLRRDNISKKESEVHGLMQSLQEMSDAMTRVHFEKANAASEDASKLFSGGTA